MVDLPSITANQPFIKINFKIRKKYKKKFRLNKSIHFLFRIDQVFTNI